MKNQLLPAAARSPLEAIASLTLRMLRASDEADWSLVSTLNSARDVLLINLPSDCFSDNNKLVREILENALAATRELAGRAQQARDADAETLQTIRRQHRGAAHYLTHAGAD
ncbi:MAG: phasin family protein [Gammaproteobacteria bacterium]|nr:phasin family protein [Gammaproteobacteria bacterium]